MTAVQGSEFAAFCFYEFVSFEAGFFDSIASGKQGDCTFYRGGINSFFTGFCKQ